MPAVTERQRVAAAIAEHHPEKLYARNRGMLSMTGEQLHEFASKHGGGHLARAGRLAKRRKKKAA